MKPHIDLDKAAEAEGFGALAIRSGHKRSKPSALGGRFTPAQANALAELAHTFLKVAREVGAEQKRIVVGDISFDLRENGSEEILSIRAAVAG